MGLHYLSLHRYLIRLEKGLALTRFIQASLCLIQGLFKDFLKTFLLFSKSENLYKVLIYTLKHYF